MQIEILGSGGAVTIPRPGCGCRVCVEARERGIPFSRTGPSFFIHGPQILIDTPEEAKDQLNRAGILEVRACFYSHWHPDHVMGRRLWEMNQDWRRWPARNRQTNLYIPARVAEDFRQTLGTWAHLEFLERRGLVRLNELAPGEGVAIDGVQIRPFPMAEDYVYAFLIEREDRRALIIPDELLGWSPPPELVGLDLVILPKGLSEFNPLTGARHWPADHPVLQTEATFRQSLEIARRLAARRTVFSHIEEPDELSHTDLQRVAEKLHAEEGLAVEFGYDGMRLEV